MQLFEIFGLIKGEKALFSKVLVRFVVAVLLVEAAELLLNHIFVLFFEWKHGLVTNVAVTFKGIDFSAEALIGFGGVLNNYFEVSIILNNNVVLQALSVLWLWWSQLMVWTSLLIHHPMVSGAEPDAAGAPWKATAASRPRLVSTASRPGRCPVYLVRQRLVGPPIEITAIAPKVRLPIHGYWVQLHFETKVIHWCLYQNSFALIFALKL